MTTLEPDVSVRRATPDDIESLLELRQMLFATGQAHWARGDSVGWEREYLAQLAAELSPDRSDGIRRQATFIATVDSEPSATLTAIIDEHLANPANPSGRTGWIQGVYVTNSARGLGLGTALTRAAEAWLASEAVQEVYLDSTQMALNMYTRLGYDINDEPHLRKRLNLP